MPSKPLHKTYVRTLRSLRDLTLANGFPPTMAELALARALSPTGAKKHVATLARAELVTVKYNNTRSCVVTDAGRKVLKNRT